MIFILILTPGGSGVIPKFEKEGLNVQGNQEACMFNIMELSEDALRKVLPKISIRIVSRLISSYPRAIGRTMLNVMSETMHPLHHPDLKG